MPLSSGELRINNAYHKIEPRPLMDICGKVEECKFFGKIPLSEYLKDVEQTCIFPSTRFVSFRLRERQGIEQQRQKNRSKLFFFGNCKFFGKQKKNIHYPSPVKCISQYRCRRQ